MREILAYFRASETHRYPKPCIGGVCFLLSYLHREDQANTTVHGHMPSFLASLPVELGDIWAFVYEYPIAGLEINFFTCAK